MFKTRRVGWLGHLEKMPREKKIVKGNPIGKKHQSRPRKSWIEVVEQDLKTLNVRDWKKTAKNPKVWKK